jgi:hypothetical protein
MTELELPISPRTGKHGAIAHARATFRIDIARLGPLTETHTCTQNRLSSLVRTCSNYGGWHCDPARESSGTEVDTVPRSGSVRCSIPV